MCGKAFVMFCLLGALVLWCFVAIGQDFGTKSRQAWVKYLAMMGCGVVVLWCCVVAAGPCPWESRHACQKVADAIEAHVADKNFSSWPATL